jgi:hypothetical protein
MLPDRQSLAEKAHRRETLVQIILPFAAVLVVVLIGGGIALVLPRPAQVSILADLMLALMCLFPAVICLFPLALGLMAAAFGMNVVHGSAGKLLRRGEGLTARLLERTSRLTEGVNQQTINLSARFAFLEKLIGSFEDDPASSSTKDKPND